jgi:hypothetical protein
MALPGKKDTRTRNNLADGNELSDVNSGNGRRNRDHFRKRHPMVTGGSSVGAARKNDTETDGAREVADGGCQARPSHADCIRLHGGKAP